MHTTNFHESSFPSSSKYTQEFDLATSEFQKKCMKIKVFELNIKFSYHKFLGFAEAKIAFPLTLSSSRVQGHELQGSILKLAHVDWQYNFKTPSRMHILYLCKADDADRYSVVLIIEYW